MQYFENNKLFKSEYLKDNIQIKEIIDKINNLSNNPINVIKDFKEKFDYLGDRIYEYTQISDKKAGSNENKINNIQSAVIKFYELINVSNERISAIEDFKNNTMTNIENVLKNINDKQNTNDITNKKVENIEELLQNNNIKIEDIKIENKKEIKDIDIQNYENNKNEKELKYKIFKKITQFISMILQKIVEKW